MCVYSMIADHYRDKWQGAPHVPPQPLQPMPSISPRPWIVTTLPTPEEIEDFRKDAAELKKLLERAKEYDKKNQEPDCELEEKKQALREIAKQYGVEIEFP